MQKLYPLFLNKQPPQQALKETSGELKNSKEWQDQFFWVPFDDRYLKEPGMR